MHRRVLAEVALEADDADARVSIVDRAETCVGGVGGAVVDEDGLPLAAVERRGDSPVELLDGTLLVQHRDDNRNVHPRDPIPGKQRAAVRRRGPT